MQPNMVFMGIVRCGIPGEAGSDELISGPRPARPPGVAAGQADFETRPQRGGQACHLPERIADGPDGRQYGTVASRSGHVRQEHSMSALSIVRTGLIGFLADGSVTRRYCSA